MKPKNQDLYSIESADLGESSRFEPRWSNKELTTWGNSLDELLENAGYAWIDQDGEDLDSGPADDQAAYDYIHQWYEENKNPEAEAALREERRLETLMESRKEDES